MGRFRALLRGGPCDGGEVALDDAAPNLDIAWKHGRALYRLDHEPPAGETVLVYQWAPEAQPSPQS